MIPTECQTHSNASKIKISEARSTTAVFANPERLKHSLIKFDGCVLKNEVACDWIIVRDAVGRIAVELKGSDVDHAVEQIEKALLFLRQNNLMELPVAGLVICTRYPAIDTKVQRLKQRLAKAFRAPLTVRRDGRDLSFDALLRF